MKKFLALTAIAASLVSGASMAVTPTGENFNDTGDILARSAQHTDIEYEIMVQRATQAAIYYMPAVAQVDFIKATLRAGGDYDTVNFVQTQEEIGLSQDLSGFRILVVDDEDSVRNIVARTLERHGCQVSSARSGEEAMQHLASVDIDFVLTDVVMPGISGTDLIAAMRTAGYSQPVLLMSGHTRDNLVPSEAGAFGFLKKPFRSEELVETVQTLIRR